MSVCFRPLSLVWSWGGRRTLNVSNGLLKDLLEDLGVLELLLDLGDNALGELLLLALLDLALVADPGVKDSLGLGGESGALLELIGLSLKLGGFLEAHVSLCLFPLCLQHLFPTVSSFLSTTSMHPMQPMRPNSGPGSAYLGNSKESLGVVDDTRHLLDVLDAGLDGLGVVGAGRVQDVLDLVALLIGPLLVKGTTELDEATPDREQAEGDDGLLVHDIVLVGDGVDGKTGGGGEDGGLGNEVAAGKGVDDGLGLGLGVLGREAGRVAGGSDGAERREGAGNDAGPEAGSPYGNDAPGSATVSWC